MGVGASEGSCWGPNSGGPGNDSGLNCCLICYLLTSGKQREPRLGL